MKNKLSVFLFFFIVTSTSLAFLWLHLDIRNLNYEYQLLVIDKNKLVEENKKLQINYAEINSPIDIEKIAKEKLGLIKPKEKQFRYIK